MGMATHHDAMFATRIQRLLPIGRTVIVDSGDVLHRKERMPSYESCDLETKRPHGSFFEGSHSRDFNRSLKWTTFHCCGDFVDLDLKAVSEYSHHRRPDRHQRHLFKHLRHDVHRAAQTDHVAHDVGCVIERVIEDLLNTNLGDSCAYAAHEGRQDVERPAGINTGNKDRGIASFHRWSEHPHQLGGSACGVE